jgi:hypothetical protein
MADAVVAWGDDDDNTEESSGGAIVHDIPSPTNIAIKTP